jgi:hypothetical protein
MYITYYVLNLTDTRTVDSVQHQECTHKDRPCIFFKGLVAPATLFVYFLYFFLQYIHSYTQSCFLIALRSVKGLPGVPSRIRTRACRTASRRTISELRRTLAELRRTELSYASPSELRRNL